MNSPDMHLTDTPRGPLTRRGAVQRLSGIAAAASLGAGLAGGCARAEPAGGWRMPDEHLPQARVFLAYAARPAVWEDTAGAVNRTIAMLARTIARYQPVTVLCPPDLRAQAERDCAADGVDYLTLPLDDVWVRDYGGVFVRDGTGALGLVDFNFNGWGGKQAADADGAAAEVLGEKLGARYIASRLTGEGGGLEVDGHGTAILTESCWVNDNRNPGLDRAQIEAELKALLGLRKVIWLPGIRGKDITDAHVDFYARFVRPGVVLANLDNDPLSYDHAVTRRHMEILSAATDADGRRLEVHALPPPLRPRSSVHNRDNPDFAAGYINFLPVNGAVIAPAFGDRDADEHCRRVLTGFYRGREVVQVNIDPIAAGGGGIHCVAKNLMRPERRA